MNQHIEFPFSLPEAALAGLPTGAVRTATDQLGKDIVQGSYPQGSTLPNELALAEHLRVSRTVIREAIKVLSGKGLVRTARRYGTRVASMDDWMLLDPDVVRWHEPNSPAAQKLLRESTQLRTIIEPEAAALAAQNATDAQLRVIAVAAQHIKPDPFGCDVMIAADYTFHATILDACGNTLLSQLKHLIRELVPFSYSEGIRSKEFDTLSRRHHLIVATEIASRNPSGARAQMKKMLEHHALLIKEDADKPANSPIEPTQAPVKAENHDL